MNRRLAIVYLCASVLVASGQVMNPDGHLRIAQARAWVEDSTLALPPNVGNVRHGNIAVGELGKRYAVYSPGQSIIFAPLMAVALALPQLPEIDPHYVAAFFASFIGPATHFLTAFVLFLFARDLRLPHRHALLISALFAGATFSLPHATDSYEHPQEALFILLGLFLANRSYSSRDRQNQAALCIVSGLAIGLAILFRSTAILSIPSALILLRLPRSGVLFFLGVVPPVLLTLGYNYIRFGSPLESGYSYAWAAVTETPPDVFSNFAHPLARGLFGLWLSPGKGMLIFSPILLLAVANYYSFWNKQRRVAASILLITAAYSLFYSANFAWHGSPWCWGPRYLIPLVPLLMLALPPIARLKGAWRIVALVLVVASLLVQLVAITVDYRRQLIVSVTTTPDIFDDDSALFELSRSPILQQLHSFYSVVTRLGDEQTGDYRLFLQPGIWRNEGRPATQEMMLSQSVDLNVPNFWWMRIGHVPLPHFIAFAFYAVAIGLSMVLVSLLAITLWNEIRPST